MSEGLEKLKSIGAQKIHENTHISKIHVQAIFGHSFDNMTKIQFCGFISILEREYSIKLDSLREEGIEYFQENTIVPEQEADVFTESKLKKNSTKIYIVIGVIVFLIVALISTYSSSSSSSTVVEELDNSAIESAKSVSSNQNINDPEPIVEEVIEPVVVKYFSIKPKSKLWIGYIELGVHKKNQKTITEELVLDPNKDWLLSLGHGYVDFDVNGKTIEYKKGKNLRFVYRDGELTKINFEEFKRINKGNEW